jgi:hypothetical protein
MSAIIHNFPTARACDVPKPCDSEDLAAAEFSEIGRGSPWHVVALWLALLLVPAAIAWWLHV